jgi:acyl-CoA hydrolase
MKNVMDKMQEMLDNNYKGMIKQNTEVLSSIVKIEKDLNKQGYIFGGTILTAIITAIIKLIFGI